VAATRRRGGTGRGTPGKRRPGAKAKAKAKARTTPAREAKAAARKTTPARAKAPAARKAKAPPARKAKAPSRPGASKAPARRRRSPPRPTGPAPGLAEIAALAERDDRETADEVLELFRHYDRDGSGSIDARELATLLEALGASPSEEELAVALDVVDRNRSGKISWPEFSAWWKGR
jgi:hypothetical protein